jgi:hypothetical protein
MKLFIVTMEDTITQIRDYAVLAEDQSHAENKIEHGEFLNEGAPETTGTTDSQFKAIVEIDMNGAVVA